MHNPAKYWEQRYRDGRSSGAGSEGVEGEYKAAFITEFIRVWGVERVIDWGCGDGQVLDQIDLNGAEYIGIDVSPTVVSKLGLKYLYNDKMLFTTPSVSLPDPGDLSMSMDVVFHLTDDNDYYLYMVNLFESSNNFVIIYSTNYVEPYNGNHVKRRNFTIDVAAWFPEWELMHVTQPLYDGAAQFFIYEKRDKYGIL